ncbi:agrin-like isoform X2 [Phthorimaea operculella]|nr:agrin-like isoform X2 [Phthorimaea operculella]
MRFSMVIVYVIAAAIVAGGEFRIRGKVRKRYTAHRRHREILPPCHFNETIIDDEWSLMEAIGKSKFIFTGKVLHVRKLKGLEDKRSNLYRVYLRRVLKGDLGELKGFVKVEGIDETLTGSTVMAERPRAREWCAPAPRPRLSAIFLSDGAFTDVLRGPTPRLRLVTDPVPLTLYHLDRINAAVKGKSCF